MWQTNEEKQRCFEMTPYVGGDNETGVAQTVRAFKRNEHVVMKTHRIMRG